MSTRFYLTRLTRAEIEGLKAAVDILSCRRVFQCPICNFIAVTSKTCDLYFCSGTNDFNFHHQVEMDFLGEFVFDKEVEEIKAIYK